LKVEDHAKATLAKKHPLPQSKFDKIISKHKLVTKMEEERIQVPFREVAEPLLQPPADILSDIKNISHKPKEDFTDEQSDNNNIASVSLRKKVCKKLAKLLEKCYLLERNSAQELTIQIEDKLNRFIDGKENEYKQTIKVLHKLMKARKLKLDDLNNLDDHNLNHILKFKVHELTKKT